MDDWASLRLKLKLLRLQQFSNLVDDILRPRGLGPNFKTNDTRVFEGEALCAESVEELPNDDLSGDSGR